MKRVALVFVLGCSRDAPIAVRTDAGAPDAAPPPSASAPASPRATLSRSLAEGRERAHQKRWPEAIVAFERALASAPDDVVVLNELAWAAVNAGDDTKAKRAVEWALALQPPPELEAQALYNEGRRLEARGQTERAAAAYERSLADRENVAVRKRLAALGDAGAATANAAFNAPALPCANAPGDVVELRRCLEGFAAVPSDAMFFFEPDTRRTLPPGTSLYRFGARQETRQRTTLLLVAPTKRGLLPIALLGTSTGTAEITGAERHDPVWLVRSSVSRIDQSLSGLEVREESTDFATACIFSAAEPSCPVQVPTSLHSKLAYPSPGDLDSTERALVEDRVAEVGAPYDRRTELRAEVRGLGLRVTFVSGQRGAVPPGVLGTHALTH